MSIQTATTGNLPLNVVGEDITFGQALPIVSQFSSDFNSEDTANEARARNGWLAVSTYGNKVYGSAAHEPVEQGIRDLLGDLHHLCHALGLDFEDLAKRADAVFQEELIDPIG